MSQRARTDKAVMARIREQYSLSHGGYGRPSMARELKEAGLDVGERRVGRLLWISGIRPVRIRKLKQTNHRNNHIGVAPNLLAGDFLADVSNRKCAGDFSYASKAKGWL